MQNIGKNKLTEIGAVCKLGANVAGEAVVVQS